MLKSINKVTIFNGYFKKLDSFFNKKELHITKKDEKK